MLKALFLSLAVLLSLPVFAHEESSALTNPQVIIKTNQGDITLRLFRDKAPISVDNFLSYVDSGHYAGTIFHRVISKFMIQGGGFTTDMTLKAVNDPIANESKNRLHNIRGTVAMARTNDPDSATAQFFINQRTNLQLDWTPMKPGYTVFGEVIDGMSVVDFMSSAPVQQILQHSSVPVDPIIITEVVRKPQL